MTNSLSKRSEIFLIYLGFSLVIFIAGLTAQNGFSLGAPLWTATAEQYSEGLNDVNTYIRLGQYFAGLIPESLELLDVSQIWTPGFPFLIGGLLKFTGGKYYFLKLLLICTSTLAATFTFFYYAIPFHRKGLFRFISWSSLVFLPNLKECLVGTGLGLSEWSTLVFCLMGWTGLFLGIERGNRRLILLAGVSFGLAANFRALVSVLSELMVFLAIFALIISAFWIRLVEKRYQLVNNRLISQDRRFVYQGLRLMLFLALVFFCMTFPWRMRNFIVGRHFSMTNSHDISYQAHWSKSPPRYLVTGDAACHSDPSLCNLYHDQYDKIKHFRKQLVLFTFLTKPIQWITYKIENFNWFWTGLSWLPDKTHTISWFFGKMEGLFYFVVGGLAVFRLTARKTSLSDTTRKSLLFYTYLFIAAYVAVFTIAHFESRFSLFLRVYLFWLFIFTFMNQNTGLLNSTRPNPSPSQLK